MNELYKELEIMDLNLQQARLENCRLNDEKTTCIVAHERDVATLAGMLKSVMAENAKLKEALLVARGHPSPKLGVKGRLGDLELDVISSLIESGIPYLPATPHSHGSTSTHTPPFEPEAEACSLDVSRASISLSVQTMP
jgi:hypothetical protein